MPNAIAIRLAVEGGAEVRRTLEDAGRAGQAAFQGVGAAADQAGAATDRQTARFQKLAQAAREAEAQARAQANINALLGVSTGPAGSARDSASVFEAELARQDQIRAARQEQAARTSQANINTLLGVREAQIGAARASAAAFEDAAKVETEALRRAADARTATIRNTITGWRDLSAQGAATLANIDASKRLGSINKAPEPANQNQPGRRLRPDEITNLLYQGGDVVAQAGAGASAGLIALQQGPQVAQIFAGPGGASVKGALGQARDAAGGFLQKIGPVGIAIGGLTLAAGVGAAALLSYRSAQAETERAIGGVGRASGVTLREINALADAQARSSGVSVRSARELAITYAATGRVGPDLLPDALGATRGFAGFLGVDDKEGATALAGILSDVSRGATELTERYGLLSGAQAESIKRMEAQGDRLGATRQLLDAVRNSTRDLGQETSRWSRVTGLVSDAWGGLGSTIDRVLGGTGGGADERIRDVLQERLRQQQSSIVRAASSRGGDMEDSNRAIAETKQELEAVERRIAAARRLGQDLERNRLSAEIGGLVRLLQPELVALQTMQDRVELLRKAIADPIRFGLDRQQLSDATTAFERLSTLARTMADDIERFGSTSVAAANRQAEFGLRTATMNPVDRAAAEIERDFQDRIKTAGINPNGRTPAQIDTEAEFRRSLTSDPFERNRIDEERVSARERAINDARQYEGLLRARDLRLEELRQRTQDSAIRSTRIPETLAQAIMGAESGGRDFARNPNSTATGAGQFIDETWLRMFRERFAERAAGMNEREILARRTNRADTEALVEALAQENARALEKAGLPVNAANLYAGHHFGERGMLALLRADPGERTRSILGDRVASANPQTVGNQTVGGTLSSLAGMMARNDPGIRASREQVEVMRSQVGLDGQSAESAARLERAQELLNQERAKGTEIGRAFVTAQELIRASSEQLTPEMAAQRKAILETADAYGRVTAVANDYRGRQTLMFERDQLGRSSIEASVYARTFSQYRETNSPESRAFMAQARENAEMYETKALLTNGVTSFVSDLRRGGDAAAALSNAFGSAADRLMSKALDSVISSAFAPGGGSGGGGVGGFIASLFGGGDSPTGGVRLFDAGGYTGPGERLQAAGIVHRGEVVFSQDDVRRHGGVAIVEAMRRGLPGFADGGPVGRDAFTMPNRAAMQPANDLGPSISAPISITMQGSTGDPAKDREHIEQTAAALREQMRAVFHQEQSRSLMTNGALWQAGVRRARA